jgi:hypothetical protein
MVQMKEFALLTSNVTQISILASAKFQTPHFTCQITPSSTSLTTSINSHYLKLMHSQTGYESSVLQCQYPLTTLIPNGV